MSDYYDPAEVKRRLAFLDLMVHEGVVMRRNGGNFVAPCPFHEEKSGSFTVHGNSLEHAHCYGCGWNGDIFDFYQARHGGDFVSAVRFLASLASVAPEVWDRKRQQAAQVPRVTESRSKQLEKPPLPKMRRLEEKEIVSLAKLRGLSVEGVATAAAAKRVGACLWPQFLDHNGAWRAFDDAANCWVVTDQSRNVAQFRRFDGEKFKRKDMKEIKAWTKGSPTWPLGASEIGDHGCVLLVEGGADMLAGYHFLTLFKQLNKVAVCAMLGASCSICAEALPFFERKRVRIIMDVDEANKKTGLIPSFEAAARWTRQLTEIGAAVESFSLAGLIRKDGQPVKDLNDLAMVNEDAWLDEELRQAFFDFDF